MFQRWLGVSTEDRPRETTFPRAFVVDYFVTRNDRDYQAIKLVRASEVARWRNARVKINLLRQFCSWIRVREVVNYGASYDGQLRSLRFNYVRRIGFRFKQRLVFFTCVLSMFGNRGARGIVTFSVWVLSMNYIL